MLQRSWPQPQGICYAFVIRYKWAVNALTSAIGAVYVFTLAKRLRCRSLIPFRPVSINQLLSQKRDLLGTKRRLFCFELERLTEASLLIYLFKKQNLHHAKLPCRKNLLPCIKTCPISNQTIWEMLFVCLTCTCIDSSNHLHFSSFKGKRNRKAYCASKWRTLQNMNFYTNLTKISGELRKLWTTEYLTLVEWAQPFWIFNEVSQF